MPFEFVKVEMHHSKIEKPLGECWMIKLSNTVEALDFLYKHDNTLQEAFYDMIKKANGNKHWTNRLAEAAEVTAHDGESWMTSLSRINTNRVLAILRNLPVYINSKGGWVPVNEDCKEIETRVADRWPTSEEPRYLQWPNGAHWYVKAGANDVEVDGITKWNTRTEAEEAYQKWMKKN